jgi:hypothetical protein
MKLSQLEQQALDALLEFAEVSYFAFEDSEEAADSEGRTAIEKDHMEKVWVALDKLDDLPDDQPGYTMGPIAKVQYALRFLRNDN